VYAAAEVGRVEAIRAFYELGADINALAQGGCTPVHVVTEVRHEKVMKLLRKLGAKMDVVSVGGTPVAISREMGHDAMAEKLTRYTSECACCQKQATATVKLSACSRCLKTYYCSAQCQKQDWKQHKKTCSPPAAPP
jgi:hypothetical protein